LELLQITGSTKMHISKLLEEDFLQAGCYSCCWINYRSIVFITYKVVENCFLILQSTFRSVCVKNLDSTSCELWSLLLDEMSEYLTKLKELIVSSYEENHYQPVILLGHSMGNLYIHYLLKHQSSSWKQTYIKSFISLAGPWGGAVKTVRLQISGWLLAVVLLVFQLLLICLSAEDCCVRISVKLVMAVDCEPKLSATV